MKEPHRWLQESFPGQSPLSSMVLGAGNGLTGAGTVLLGVLLPVLSEKWGIRDNTGGSLLFLQFLGSSLGAVCVGADRVRALRIGYGLLMVCACGLAFSGLSTVFPLLFFYGLGLGMAMTATSLLFSDRYGDDRAAKLQRLNFAWSAGAAVAPALIVLFLHMANLRLLFFTFQGLFFCLLVWTITCERQKARGSSREAEAAPGQNPAALWLLAPLVAMAMCSVGVETSLSSWLTTYSHRADRRSLGTAALTTSLFLLGFVLSRLAFSTRLLAIVGRRRTLHILLGCTAACVVLLTAAHSLAMIRIASGLSGLCVGPLYPLLLSYLLERSPRGWIFAAAGMGAVVFPWLTGVLSAHYGSLRFGLIAPCAAALLMILLVPASFRRAPATLPTSAQYP